ncbi:MAG TPA: Flp family type IVb pilin [Stellaceae bacterium]|nr:Flp family type IVb pilin [Stellaceae bacterium]
MKNTRFRCFRDSCSERRGCDRAVSGGATPEFRQFRSAARPALRGPLAPRPEDGGDETGATAIEYGLIAALIAVAAVVVMGQVGTNLSSTFGTIASNL